MLGRRYVLRYRRASAPWVMRRGAAAEGYLKIGGKTLVSGTVELGCTASMLLTLRCSGLEVRVHKNPEFLHKLHNYPADSTSEARTP